MYMESDTVELKQELNKNIKKEIVALANSKGGTIYIGINDEGNVVGLNNIKKDVETLSGMIREGIVGNLTIYTDIETKKIDNKDIIELHITSAPEKPYYLADKGLKPSGVYIRHGSSSIQASDEIIRAMMKESSKKSFEEEISANQNLTFKDARQAFNSKHVVFAKNKYKSLKMLTDDDKYNNLALLISDQNPFTVKCAVFEGNDKTLFRDRSEYTGSCFKIVEDVFKYIHFVNHVSSTFHGLSRIDRTDYPEFSTREALLNAIIHRSYFFTGSILLSVFDNRIEINSLGGLVSRLSLADVYNGVSESRNPNLAELFHRLNYVENYGTGIGRIIKEYDEYDVKPQIELSENVFKIILPNINYFAKNQNEITNFLEESNEKFGLIDKENENTPLIDNNKGVGKYTLSQTEIIINYLIDNGKITRVKLESLLNIRTTRSKIIINKLLDESIIMKQGVGRNTYYVLTDQYKK